MTLFGRSISPRTYEMFKVALTAVVFVLVALYVIYGGVSLALTAATLATYRVSHMLVGEDGPFNVFLHWRSFLSQRLGHGHWVYEGFTCVLCISFWLSWVTGYWVGLANYPMDVLAVAGGCLLVHKVIYR